MSLEAETGFYDWLRGRTSWDLTPRESQVLFWLYQGKTNGEIGRILGIAERTAETHALRLYPKMGVENRYTAIATLNRLATVEVR
jgi:DNA-binding CsgD family transcriptional regulator